MNIKNFILVFCALWSVVTQAQDLHFSQAFNSPLSTNPANAGFIPDADYRLGAHFRNQWSAVMSVPYKTNSVFGDFQIARDKIERGWFGLGFLVLNDVAGTNSLRSTKMSLSIAYHQEIGESALLSAGINAGFATKAIDLSSLKFPDQFDGKFFDTKLPTSVVLNATTSQNFDLQTGVNFAYFPTEKVYFNAGFSAHHLNRPRETFFLFDVNNDVYGQKIPIRYIAFLNGIVKASDRIIYQPHLFITSQARTSNIVAGATANYNLSGNGDKQLIGGLHYRWADALIPMAGIEVNKLRLVYSFDATVSNLNKFNNFRGAHEISLIKKGIYQSKQREWKCPNFGY